MAYLLRKIKDKTCVSARAICVQLLNIHTHIYIHSHMQGYRVQVSYMPWNYSNNAKKWMKSFIQYMWCIVFWHSLYLFDFMCIIIIQWQMKKLISATYTSTFCILYVLQHIFSLILLEVKSIFDIAFHFVDCILLYIF